MTTGRPQQLANRLHIGTGGSGPNAKACSVCGCIGHTRINRICPLYDEETSGRVDRLAKPKKTKDPRAGALHAEGTRLTMTKRTAQ